jgi:5-methylcytosine-specific restriction endonuclease McrA
MDKLNGRKKKPKLPSRSGLQEKLDILVKTAVKIRDNYTCQKCGQKVEGSNCQASHVIPVSAGNKLRWDPLNLKVLCYHDHLNWWHKNPLEAAEWFKQKFPDRWEYLQANKGIRKYETYELVEMVARLAQISTETGQGRTKTNVS